MNFMVFIAWLFLGKLILVGPDSLSEELLNARKQTWGNLSDPAKEQFFWENPGVDYSGVPKVPVGGRDENGAILPPPINFLLMLLIPEKVKYLCLRNNFAQNDLKTDEIGNIWNSNRVNP